MPVSKGVVQIIPEHAEMQMQQTNQKTTKRLFSFITFLIFILVIFATNRNTGSDPRGTLLVTESIIKRGTIKLDNYGAEALEAYGYRIQRKNDHYYYSFPIGSSLASIPFIVIANGAGLEMIKSESRTQILITAITSIIIFLFLCKLASLFLSANSALLISSIFWFGTSLSSTAGTALWSHNFATMFALMTMYYTLKPIKLNETHSYQLIASLLFAAFLCRPTMAILSPFVLLVLFTYSRVVAIKVSLILFTLLAIFLLFSLHEFNQILPDYYLPSRLAGGHFYQAFFGNLFSPARGILIYSPFIALVWLCYKYSKKSWGLKRSWLLIGLVWPISHLISISQFPHWWAGHSYGARLMTDVLPGIFLLTLYAWPINFETRRAQVFASILLVSCIFSIVINTGQGLFNRYTAKWNGEPNIDRYPGYLFDWHYPQFLANKSGHISRLAVHGLADLSEINPGDFVSHQSNAIIYINWNDAEPTHRWSNGKFSSLLFKIDISRQFENTLELHLGSLGRQTISVSINGTKIYSGALVAWDTVLEVPFNKGLLRNGSNTLAFELPDARQPGNGNPRDLELALKSFRIK